MSVIADTALKARIDTLQAAILLVLKDGLEARLDKAAAIARIYTQELGGIVACPDIGGREHVFLSYVIQLERREDLRQHMLGRGIDCKVQYPVLMPEQDAYKGRFTCHAPVARRLADQMLSLPNQDGMAVGEAYAVVEAVRDFFRDQR